MIKVSNLSFKYEDKLVLDSINLEIKDGSFVAIIGANGSGKSTLAKHFNALLLSTKGKVSVDGFDTKKNQLEVRKNVGFVFQNFEDQLVYPIVEEDVAFGLENLNWKINDIKKAVDLILDELYIKKLAKENVNILSFGQKQLVALAGVLVMQPKYIVFDEPTTMLDELNKKNIIRVIKNLNQKNKLTVIMITNVLEDIKHADYIIVLKKGRVIFADRKESLTKKVLIEANLYA